MAFTTYLQSNGEDIQQKDELLENMEKYKAEYVQFKQIADSAKPWINTKNPIFISWKSLKGNFVINTHNVWE